jgi:hypothetical protein
VKQGSVRASQRGSKAETRSELRATSSSNSRSRSWVLSSGPPGHPRLHRLRRAHTLGRLRRRGAWRHWTTGGLHPGSSGHHHSGRAQPAGVIVCIGNEAARVPEILKRGPPRRCAKENKIPEGAVMPAAEVNTLRLGRASDLDFGFEERNGDTHLFEEGNQPISRTPMSELTRA